MENQQTTSERRQLLNKGQILDLECVHYSEGPLKCAYVLLSNKLLEIQLVLASLSAEYQFCKAQVIPMRVLP